MYKISKITKDFSDNCVPCFQDTIKVSLTRTEVKLVRVGNEDILERLFSCADVMDSYSNEAGSYVGQPGYHLEGNIAVIHQWYGMDW